MTRPVRHSYEYLFALLIGAGCSPKEAESIARATSGEQGT